MRRLSFSLPIPENRKFVYRRTYSGTATSDGVGVPSQVPSPPAAESELLQTVSLCNGAIVRASHFACAAVIPSQPPAAPGARRRSGLQPNSTNPARQQRGICTAPSTPVGAEGTRPNACGGTKPRRRSRPVNLHINSHLSTEILSKNELIYPTVKIA